METWIQSFQWVDAGIQVYASPIHWRSISHQWVDPWAWRNEVGCIFDELGNETWTQSSVYNGNGLLVTISVPYQACAFIPSEATFSIGDGEVPDKGHHKQCRAHRWRVAREWQRERSYPGFAFCNLQRMNNMDTCGVVSHTVLQGRDQRSVLKPNLRRKSASYCRQT